MPLESRDARVGRRLSGRQQEVDLRKQIISNANEDAAVRACHRNDGLPTVRQGEMGRRAVGWEGDATAIHRETLTVVGERGVAPLRANDTVPALIECGWSTAGDEHELRRLVGGVGAVVYHRLVPFV